jgi:hypothetical protein
VEVDEAYIGGRCESGKGRKPADGGRKAAVAVLVERGGRVRATPMERVTGDSITAAIKAHVEPGSVLMTEETNTYHGPKVPSGKREIEGMVRHMVNHGTGEYVRGLGFESKSADCQSSSLEAEGGEETLGRFALRVRSIQCDVGRKQDVGGQVVQGANALQMAGDLGVCLRIAVLLVAGGDDSYDFRARQLRFKVGHEIDGDDPQ